MPPHRQATLQAIDVVKSYCGSNERLKDIFARGKGRGKIYSEHPELAARLSTFDSNTIRNCFDFIKSMNTDTTMTDAEELSNKRARLFTQEGEGTHEAAQMLPRTKIKAKRPDTTEEKMVQEAKDFTFVNVTLRTNDETIAAAIGQMHREKGCITVSLRREIEQDEIKFDIGEKALRDKLVELDFMELRLKKEAEREAEAETAKIHARLRDEMAKIQAVRASIGQALE